MFQTIGQTEEEASFKINKLVEVIRKESPIEVKRIDDLDEWHKIWLSRESALLYACQREKGLYSLSEIVSTVSNLVDCLKDTLKMADGMPTLEKLGKPYLCGHFKKKKRHLNCYFYPWCNRCIVRLCVFL